MDFFSLLDAQLVLNTKVMQSIMLAYEEELAMIKFIDSPLVPFMTYFSRAETLHMFVIIIVNYNAELYRINGKTVLIGDGTKQPKAGRRMAGAKKLVQESEESTKAEYIYGYLFGVVNPYW